MTTDDEQILEISKKKYFGSMDKASSSFQEIKQVLI